MEISTRHGGWGRRHGIVGLTALAMLIAYSDRVNMSVAALAMRTQFGWSESVKGGVLAAFFVGYLVCMLPAGWLANRYGGKRVLAGAVIWWSAFTALTPLAASVSINTLVATRIALGMGESAVMPAAFALLANWAPAGERTRAAAFFLSGIPLGQIAGLIGAGALTQRFGWPSSFYLFGALGLVWTVVWLRRASESPADDPKLSVPERALFVAPVAMQPAAGFAAWRSLARHGAVWAVIAIHFGANWSLYVLLSWLPSYFHDVVRLSISNAGLYAAAPSLISFVSANLVAFLADRALARGANALTVRRALVMTGAVGAAAILLTLRNAHSATLAVAMLCAAAGFMAFVSNSFSANTLEIAPRHAALLMAMSNTFATLPGVIGVAATGWLIQVTGTYDAAFVLTAGILVGAAVVFVRFSRAEPVKL